MTNNKVSLHILDPWFRIVFAWLQLMLQYLIGLEQKKNRRILKQTSILARLRPSKSKDDKNILNHQPILVEGSNDLYNNSKVCVQNKEQGHNNSVKIRVIVFFLVMNQKFGRVSSVFLDTKLSIVLQQFSIIIFPTRPIIQNFLLLLHHNFSIFKFIHV